MDSRLTVPMDNIYKFYAIFGLALCIAGLTLFVVTYNTHYESNVALSVELAKLDLAENLTPYQTSQKVILEKQIEINSSNKDFYLLVISFLLGIGIAVVFYGFKKWHFKVQPKLDELTDLQIKKFRMELSGIQKHKPFHARGNDA